jgi:hypothetical protein
MFHETLSSHLKQFICLVSYVVRQYNNLTQVKWWNGSLQNLQFRVKEGGLFKSPFITGLISLKWRYYNAQKLRTKQQISFRFLQEKVFVWGVSKQSGSLTRKWNAVFCVFIPLYTWCWLTLLFSQKKKKIYIPFICGDFWRHLYSTRTRWTSFICHNIYKNKIITVSTLTPRLPEFNDVLLPLYFLLWIEKS